MTARHYVLYGILLFASFGVNPALAVNYLTITAAPLDTSYQNDFALALVTSCPTGYAIHYFASPRPWGARYNTSGLGDIQLPSSVKVCVAGVPSAITVSPAFTGSNCPGTATPATTLAVGDSVTLSRCTYTYGGGTVTSIYLLLPDQYSVYVYGHTGGTSNQVWAGREDASYGWIDVNASNAYGCVPNYNTGAKCQNGANDFTVSYGGAYAQTPYTNGYVLGY